MVNFGIALKIALQWFRVDEHVKGQGWMNMVFKMTPVDPPAPFDRVDEDITEKEGVIYPTWALNEVRIIREIQTNVTPFICIP